MGPEWVPEVFGGIGALRASNCERQLPYREERHFQHPTDVKQDIVHTHTHETGIHEKKKRKKRAHLSQKHHGIMYSENDHFKFGKPS